MLAAGIIRRTKGIGIARNSRDGGGVSYEIHATFTASTRRLGPLQRRKRIINRTFSLSCSPSHRPFLSLPSLQRASRLCKPFGSGREHRSRKAREARREGEGGGRRRHSATICFIILLGFRGNIGVIYGPPWLKLTVKRWNARGLRLAPCFTRRYFSKARREIDRKKIQIFFSAFDAPARVIW